MKNDACILLMAVIWLSTIPAFSHAANILELDGLRNKADSILDQSNVTARRDIGVVFELVDRLLEEGLEDAEHYLVEGLKHYPWNLKYQLIYAELLAKGGRLPQAKEKAYFVLQHGETDDLIERARKLLDDKPLPTFDGIVSIPGSNHCVVLVPLKEADVWLVVELKSQLSAVLGIPVYIQTIEADYPPFGRDRRGAILNQMRRKLKEEIDDPSVAKALKDLRINPKDLDDETILLRVMRDLMTNAGPEAYPEFLAHLEQTRGKDPQWNADQLQFVLFRAVEPYRRGNVAYLGITSVDIYAEDYNFLFGWANPQGGVMSYRRFTAGFNDEIPNQARLIKRSLMQCLSSIGHIYGIERCTTPTCARAYPNSLSEHDAKNGALCSQCASGFKRIFEQADPGHPPQGVGSPEP